MRLRRRHKRGERRIAAERGVDVQVVLCVVPMVRPRLEDRVQPDRVDTEVLQVLQLLLDPLQVAAEEVPVERRAGIDGLVPPEVRFRGRVAVEQGTPGGRSGPAVVVRRVAVAEPVRKERVHDGALLPRRRRERRCIDRDRERDQLLRRRDPRPAAQEVAVTVVAVPEGSLRDSNSKVVAEDHRRGRRCRGRGPHGPASAHRDEPLPEVNAHAPRSRARYAQPQRHLRPGWDRAERRAVRRVE